MAIMLIKRERCYYDPNYPNDSNRVICESTAWDNWVRWVVLILIVIGFFLLFACCSLTSARRRRRQGLNPYYGTGWVNHGRFAQNQPQYNNNNQHWAQPAPPYSAAPQQYSHGGYYAQQNGVELQSSPSSPLPAHARAGENVYQPPAGPPPSKA